jgi:hypothetical protein
MAASKRKPGKPDIHATIERLAAEEQKFLDQEFLAPVVREGIVRVRMGGVECRLQIEPPDFEGWGVFQPVSLRQARLLRQAGLAERRHYLNLFPMVRLIVCRRQGRRWFGAAASFGDTRLRIEGLAPIELAEEVQPFDVVAVRYDGSIFWFDDPDSRRDPATAAYLRAALDDNTEPGQLDRRGLTAEERAAYELLYWERVRPTRGHDLQHANARRQRSPAQADSTTEDPVAQRLRESLSHAGARLIGYVERADGFQVTYRAGGQQFTTAVDKEDLTIQVAGICLSGEDRKFDLASLVGVLREGERDRGLLHVGNEDHAMPEEDYWRVHPPRNR